MTSLARAHEQVEIYSVYRVWILAILYNDRLETKFNSDEYCACSCLAQRSFSYTDFDQALGA